MQSFGTFSDPIGTGKRSAGIDGEVGSGRCILFSIPVAPAYVACDGNELMMKPIQDALQRAGCRVSFAGPDKSPSGSTLKYQFKKFWFNQYTWVFPLIPAWGDMGLTASLPFQLDKLLWSQESQDYGFTMNLFNGYSSAAEQSMAEILNAMVDAFSIDAFHAVLTQSRP